MCSLFDHFIIVPSFSLTLNVNLNDLFAFICRAEGDVEDPADVYENLIRLEVDRCNVTEEMVTLIDFCDRNGSEITVPVTDTTLNLANRPRFVAGGVYYFTSEYQT